MTEGRGAEIKIPLVDSRAGDPDSLGRALTDARYELAMASSGGAAVAMLDDESPDLILSLSDVSDMDGYDLFTIVRRHPGNDETPFLLLAGWDRPSALAAAEVGATAVLTGDVTSENVVARVAEVVGTRDTPNSDACRRRAGAASEERPVQPLWAALEAVRSSAGATPAAGGFQGSLDRILADVIAESSAVDALLIDRSGQPLARADSARALGYRVAVRPGGRGLQLHRRRGAALGGAGIHDAVPPGHRGEHPRGRRQQ